MKYIYCIAVALAANQAIVFATNSMMDTELYGSSIATDPTALPSISVSYLRPAHASGSGPSHRNPKPSVSAGGSYKVTISYSRSTKIYISSVPPRFSLREDKTSSIFPPYPTGPPTKSRYDTGISYGTVNWMPHSRSITSERTAYLSTLSTSMHASTPSTEPQNESKQFVGSAPSPPPKSSTVNSIHNTTTNSRVYGTGASSYVSNIPSQASSSPAQTLSKPTHRNSRSEYSDTTAFYDTSTIVRTADPPVYSASFFTASGSVTESSSAMKPSEIYGNISAPIYTSVPPIENIASSIKATSAHSPKDTHSVVETSIHHVASSTPIYDLSIATYVMSTLAPVLRSNTPTMSAPFTNTSLSMNSTSIPYINTTTIIHLVTPSSITVSITPFPTASIPLPRKHICEDNEDEVHDECKSATHGYNSTFHHMTKIHSKVKSMGKTWSPSPSEHSYGTEKWKNAPTTSSQQPRTFRTLLKSSSAAYSSPEYSSVKMLPPIGNFSRHVHLPSVYSSATKYTARLVYTSSTNHTLPSTYSSATWYTPSAGYPTANHTTAVQYTPPAGYRSGAEYISPHGYYTVAEHTSPPIYSSAAKYTSRPEFSSAAKYTPTAEYNWPVSHTSAEVSKLPIASTPCTTDVTTVLTLTAAPHAMSSGYGR